MTRNWLGIATIIGVAAAAPALAQDVNLPDGPGKATVAAMCGTCHRMALLANGYTPEGWHTVMRMMLNFGVTVPKDEVTTVTDYLIKSFPERPRPAAAAISGPVEITIKQWPGPTPGARQHARSRRPEDRGDQRIPHQRPDRSARARRRAGRQYLVHRKFPQPDRQARSEDRNGDRVQAPGCRRARSALAHLRS